MSKRYSQRKTVSLHTTIARLIQIWYYQFNRKSGSTWARSFDWILLWRVNRDSSSLLGSPINHGLHAMNHILCKAVDKTGNVQVIDPVYVFLAIRATSQENTGTVTAGTACNLLMAVIRSIRNLNIERILPAASIAVIRKISNHNRILDCSIAAHRLRDAFRIDERGPKRYCLGC